MIIFSRNRFLRDFLVRANVVFTIMLFPSWLLETLTAGCRLLVPYDCGHNHGPALCGGRKAHWALVTGVVLAQAARGEQESCQLTSTKFYSSRRD